MSGWPQILVALWLLLTLSAAVWAGARPTRGWIVLTPKHQRLAALGLGAGAIGEASLLWAGGFFNGVL